MLDECELTSETDCNGNRHPRPVRDRDHPALDCNENGVPDECELTTETDCNGNGILDECELTPRLRLQQQRHPRRVRTHERD